TLAIALMMRAALAVAVRTLMAFRCVAVSLAAFAVAAVAGAGTLRPAAVAAVARTGTLRPAAAAMAAAAGLAGRLTWTTLMLTAVAAAMTDRKPFACRRACGGIFDHADKGMIL